MKESLLEKEYNIYRENCQLNIRYSLQLIAPTFLEKAGKCICILQIYTFIPDTPGLQAESARQSIWIFGQDGRASVYWEAETLPIRHGDRS